MKKLTIIFLALALTSCLKPTPTPYPQYPGLKIISWKGTSIAAPNDGPDSVRFTYNRKGNPIRVERAHTSTGITQYQLRYDQQDRLRVLINSTIGAEAIGDIFDEWHQYYYDKQQRIALDSVYVFGRIGPHGPIPRSGNQVDLGYVITFAYDSLNRIVQVTRKVGGHATNATISTYHYNQHGNAYWINEQRPYGEPALNTYPVYDDKFNPHRLHPVWQFIDQDYSTNNPFIAVGYNKLGLPTSVPIPPKTTPSFYFGLFGFITIDHIKYGY
ncbi:hypothetical protein [Chitinophaga nivalis]|uniref:YD repeat-containing protein n=1 Tax=Chitinophaga nivalis TaxID=2991709 RepID=A0ABT3IF86_9BACT|nr:hypothetical protein [Chitinophaga nivalis]MCW3467737.1 hypothetical protein [Chitinophaga nivalis]MCW3482571.1 hypothetical protein [Chitinophaga nivalis]